MTAELPPELEGRIRAFVEDIVPAGLTDEILAEIHERLSRRNTRQPAQVMAIAHDTVAERVRITRAAAAAALVDHGGLSELVATHIVGLEEEGSPGDAEVAPDPAPDAAPDASPTDAPPAEEAADPDPVIAGWDDFWSPPTPSREDAPPPDAEPGDEPTTEGPPDAEPAEGAGPADGPTPEGRGEAAPARPAPAPFPSWAAGARGRRRDLPVGPVVAAVVLILVVIVAAVTLGGGDGDDVAVGDRPTGAAAGAVGSEPATTDGTPERGEEQDRTQAPTTAGLSVEGRVGDGGPVRAGEPVLLALTVSGVGDRPMTLEWELRRDDAPLVPGSPLVVPADGDVRLTLPPVLLSEPGRYVVRVSEDGTALFERDFEVTG